MSYELNVINENGDIIYTIGRGDKEDKDFVIFDLLDKLEPILYMLGKNYRIDIRRID